MKIRLVNFRCYTDNTFEFGDEGLVLISASSGAGKSTILLGIMFALYGTGFKVQSYGKKSCKVEFEYRDLKIVRTKVPNRVVLDIDGKEYEDDAAQSIINKRFGDMFDVTGCITEDASETFIKMSPTDKLEFLEKFAFKDIDLFQIKNRCKTLITQRNDALNKTISQLEMTQNMFKELKNPEEVKFPIKAKKTDYEKVTKNEEIKKKNCDILIKRSRHSIDKLQQEINDINVLEAFLESKDDSIDSITSSLQNLTLEQDNIEYVGDDELFNYKKQLEFILNNKKLFFMEETYKIDKEKLDSMKQVEAEKIKKEISNIEENLWVEYTESDLKDVIKDTKDANKDAKKLSILKKELSNYTKFNETDLKEYKNRVETNRPILESKKQLLENIKKQKTSYKCPSCNNKLHFKNETLCLIEDDAVYEVDMDVLKTEIIDMQKDIKKLEELITNYESKIVGKNNINKEITDITSQYEDNLNEDTLTTDLEYLEEYYRSELSKSKKLKRLQTNLDNNIFTSFETFEKELDMLKANIDKIKDKTGTIELEYEEEDLRMLIIQEEKNRESLDKIEKSINKLEKEQKEFKNTCEKKKQNHIDKYNKINNIAELEESVKKEKQNITDFELKKEEHITNLETIRKYNDYIIEKNNYISWENKVKDLEVLEKELRSKYSASMLLKEKILEAESIAVANIVESINIHAQVYLDCFFNDNPIIVRLLSFKETKKSSKPQINLEINYKEMDCDLKSLSRGESSRVILAFTLALSEMFNTPILLLDECTSNLNQELTITVFDSIKDNFKDKLVILVAHQVVKGVFDTVIELDNKV